MNRELWFKILQVGVVAPWILYHSNRVDSAYFQLGLKLVAGSIFMMNAPPLLIAWQQRQARNKLTLERASTSLEM